MRHLMVVFAAVTMSAALVVPTVGQAQIAQSGQPAALQATT